MKKIFTILFLHLILISFNSFGVSSDKIICVESDAQNIKGIIYLLNDVDPFTGKNLCKYDDGQIKIKGEIIDGKVDGKIIQFYKNSQIKSETNYKNGKSNGKRTSWYENGQIKSEKNYKNGKCVSGDC